MYLFFINVCFEIIMRQTVGGLVNNEFERCGRTLSWPNVNCQEDLRRISKNPGRVLNSKLPKC